MFFEVAAQPSGPGLMEAGGRGWKGDKAPASHLHHLAATLSVALLYAGHMRDCCILARNTSSIA